MKNIISETILFTTGCLFEWYYRAADFWTVILLFPLAWIMGGVLVEIISIIFKKLRKVRINWVD